MMCMSATMTDAIDAAVEDVARISEVLMFLWPDLEGTTISVPGSICLEGRDESLMTLPFMCMP